MRCRMEELGGSRYNPNNLTVLSQTKFEAHSNWISSTEFSKEGRVLTASWDKWVKIWEIESHTPDSPNDSISHSLKKVHGHYCSKPKWLYDATFTANEERVLAYGDLEELMVFSADLTTVTEISTKFGKINKCSPSPNDANMVVVSGAQRSAIFDLNTQQLVNSHEVPMSKSNCFVDYGNTILFSSGSNLCIWDVRSQELQVNPFQYTDCTNLIYNENTQLIAGSELNNLFTMDLRTNKILRRNTRHHLIEIVDLKFSRDGIALLSCSRDFTAMLSGSENLLSWATFNSTGTSILSGAVSDDFSTVITSSMGLMNIWGVNCPLSLSTHVKSARNLI